MRNISVQHNATTIRIIFAKGLYLLLFLMLLLVLIIEGYTLITVYAEANAPLPATFGNFERVRALLRTDEQRESFSFAVAGDTAGTGTFEKIAEFIKEEPISFLVLLGDCVRNGRTGFHQYLRAELAKELRMPWPTFYVVGNHDVIKNVKKDDVSISRFEEMYGPTNFSFDYQGCLFIVLRILDNPHYSTQESLAFLESTLSAWRRDYKKAFVFMHIPPPVSQDIIARRFENSDKFIALCDKFKIDYVIAADYHGYARVQRGDTVYLVTGGGGEHLEKKMRGNFHHAVVITVGPRIVSERILFTKRAEDFEDILECFVIADVYPWMRNNLWATITLNLIIFGCGMFVLRRLLRRRQSS
jgi:hypothetical protein